MEDLFSQNGSKISKDLGIFVANNIFKGFFVLIGFNLCYILLILHFLLHVMFLWIWEFLFLPECLIKLATEFYFHYITIWTEYLVFMHVIFVEFVNNYPSFAPFSFLNFINHFYRVVCIMYHGSSFSLMNLIWTVYLIRGKNHLHRSSLPLIWTQEHLYIRDGTHS